MKKLFLTLVVAVATVMTANASGYEYLTIQKSDGTMISLASSGLTPVFADEEETESLGNRVNDVDHGVRHGVEIYELFRCGRNGQHRQIETDVDSESKRRADE